MEMENRTNKTRPIDRSAATFGVKSQSESTPKPRRRPTVLSPLMAHRVSRGLEARGAHQHVPGIASKPVIYQLVHPAQTLESYN
jgi:hypothetical protein